MKNLLPTSLPICVALFGLFSVSASADAILPEPAGADTTGFVPIFDGKTLTNWEADPKYWRVENGNLVGEVTPETLLKANSFAIWRGGLPADFELKVEYRVSARLLHCIFRVQKVAWDVFKAVNP